MNNKLPATMEKSSFPQIIGLMIFVFFLLTKDNNLKLDISKLNFNKDYNKQVKMMKGIKEYFPDEQQVLLSKIQDIFDVLSKINRIKSDEYDEVIQSQSNLPSIDKKEKILAELGKYSDSKNKELIDKVVDTKRNIFKTKDNIERHKKMVESKEMSKLESIALFMDCFKPILRDDMNKKVRKVEKVMEALMIPYEDI
ncbi:hypothetical protein GOQ29_01565 [Clostridium sp. D2Q-14]|uniref:hypothetical protein n=1 Tax=Anaeromonas gelatinilytica TaxID=2683194 RepID=UPI00193C4C08|nr:hypothetical protein [Anaeromonas gelatinilytica]MBS4534300.1 hypothetical protein [Anaeromonas gelatinilytica]